MASEIAAKIKLVIINSSSFLILRKSISIKKELARNKILKRPNDL